MNYWFTSDTHFGHAKMIEPKPDGMGRPWGTVEEMDEALISQWNARVKRRDIVYHLGDLFWRSGREYHKRLNGRVYLCEGNHDRLNAENRAWLVAVYGSKLLKLGGRLIWLSHYGHRVWPHSHYGAWHFFGHSHGGLPRVGASLDVGVDAVYSQSRIPTVEESFRPWNFDELVSILT